MKPEPDPFISGMIGNWGEGMEMDGGGRDNFRRFWERQLGRGRCFFYCL